MEMLAGFPISAAMPKFAIADKKVSKIPVRSDGVTKGKVILVNTASGEAPEMRADSSKEGSIFSKVLNKFNKI
jgi:hypothetical protein